MSSHPHRTPLRAILIIGNLALLMAPHWAFADQKRATEWSKRDLSKTSPSTSSHRASGKRRPSSGSGGHTHTSSPSRSDDDDGAGRAAGRVALGCCAAFVGAMANAPSTPRSSRNVAPPAYGGGAEYSDGAGQPPPRISQSARGPLDRTVVRKALTGANERIHRACGVSEDASVKVEVTLDPAGGATHVAFEPALSDDAFRACAENELLSVSVPPFDGEALTVAKTLEFMTAQ